MERRLAYASLVLIFVLGLFVGLSVRRPRSGGETPQPEVRKDTLWLHDTLKIQQPAPKAKTVRDTVWLPAPVPPDTSGHKSDTVYVPVPVSTNFYSGEGWEAWVSGYRASLDSLHVDQRTAIVEVPIYKTVKKRWGVGVQAGITYLPTGVTPYVGIGVSYNLLNF